MCGVSHGGPAGALQPLRPAAVRPVQACPHGHGAGRRQPSGQPGPAIPSTDHRAHQPDRPQGRAAGEPLRGPQDRDLGDGGQTHTRVEEPRAAVEGGGGQLLGGGAEGAAVPPGEPGGGAGQHGQLLRLQRGHAQPQPLPDQRRPSRAAATVYTQCGDAAGLRNRYSEASRPAEHPAVCGEPVHEHYHQQLRRPHHHVRLQHRAARRGRVPNPRHDGAEIGPPAPRDCHRLRPVRAKSQVPVQLPVCAAPPGVAISQ